MTPLRQRMIDAMVLRGMAARTQQAYVSAVAALARHYRCSPEQLDGAQVQAYLLHMVRERQLARSSVNQAGCAFRFLYHTVLERQQQVRVPLGKAEQRLPEILSREELARLFACAHPGKARAVLMTAYGLGLRVSELCCLRVGDIDGHADRMCAAHRARQRRQGPVRAAACGHAAGAACLVAPGRTLRTGCFPRNAIRPSRWTWTVPSAGTAPPVPWVASPSREASIP